MALLSSLIYKLEVESATPGTFGEIKGQQTLEYSASAQTVDTSTKDTGAYATLRAVQRSVTISVSGLADLPDSAGFSRLETVSNAAPQVPFKVRIRKSGTTTVFEGEVMATTFDKTMNRDDAVVGYRVELVSAAAPVTDTLA
jgi:predicted secreted protein